MVIGSRAKNLAINNVDLRNKRVLVTCCWLSGWSGAEINVLQLAKQLQSYGCSVDCFTYWFDGPITKDFKEANIKVITDSFNYLDTEDTIQINHIDIKDYDYIWVCQQVLPISIIRQLNDTTELPRFIFLHMSALVGIPVEAPIVWNFEKSIYDKVLSISEDVTKQIKRILGQEFSEIEYYRNPVPVEYAGVKQRTGILKKIAVISNHPPEELIGIESYMADAGISVEYVGSWNGNYALVDEKFLSQYDLIIGIGKNVQYCLVSGVPIYLYDHFGGCGYMNVKNYEKARMNNFSGRGFEKKEKATISKEILSGYEDALKFHSSKRDEFNAEYRIDEVLSRVFDRTIMGKKVNKIHFEDEYINYLESTQIILHDRFVAWGNRGRLENEVKILQGELRRSRKHVRDIKGSRSYRLGNLFLKPAKKALRGAINMTKK